MSEITKKIMIDTIEASIAYAIRHESKEVRRELQRQLDVLKGE
jgi:hypothetical protein